jgi:radical SAM enzyme (TIGR01210 family)
VSSRTEDARIRSLRPPKLATNAWKAHGFIIDAERRPDGGLERALTIFLTGAECPFTCSFCDLWRYTIDGPTPAGAIPQQIDDTLKVLERPLPQRIKLYNASNFFDRQAVPVDDLPRIAGQCAAFAGVTVESHVNTVGETAVDFSRRIPGRLEIALGLETVHPAALPYLNKRLELPRFDRTVAFLRERDIDVRVFVLLGAPYVPPDACVESAVRAVERAAQAGACVVAIIPVRGGNGEMDRLRDAGHFTPPTLGQLEHALDGCLPRHDCVVTVDLWDVERLQACAACAPSRVERLRRMNLTQRAEPRVACDVCEMT